MHRWHLLRWRGWQLSLHRIFQSDDDRALHDHRADNLSVVLRGGYLELFSHGWYNANDIVWRRPGSIIFRRAETPHRIIISHKRPVWTLWLRWPPRREWGFHCRKGWRHWKEFCAEQDYSKPGSTSTVGPGCD